jgi:hypothetical protein
MNSSDEKQIQNFIANVLEYAVAEMHPLQRAFLSEYARANQPAKDKMLGNYALCDGWKTYAPDSLIRVAKDIEALTSMSFSQLAADLGAEDG